MSARRVVQVDANAAAEAAARHVVSVLDQALRGRDLATLAISGGSTPKLLFEKLARSNVSWNSVHLFWVDERCVPPTDSASNYKLARESLIDPAGIPRTNVHRVRGESPHEAAAARYAEEIIEFFEGPPRFDLVHLGMGPDAHTASLFPGDPLVNDRDGVAASTFASKFQQWRVTLLPAALLSAKETIVLVAGADKRDAVRAVFHEEYNPLRYPAQISLNQGSAVTWFLDEAAAELLDV